MNSGTRVPFRLASRPPYSTLSVVALVAALVTAGAGCKREQGDRAGASANGAQAGAGAAGASAIGWRIDVPGEIIRAGVIRATPPGGEERLMPAVPTAVRQWAIACASDAAIVLEDPDEPVELNLTVSPSGVITDVRSAPDGIVRCLADRARSARLEGVSLPAQMRISVRLQLASGSEPGPGSGPSSGS